MDARTANMNQTATTTHMAKHMAKSTRPEAVPVPVTPKAKVPTSLDGPDPQVL